MADFQTKVNDAGDVLTVKCENTGPDWEQWFLLMSDAHWDNPKCERKLLKRHFDQAKERNAGILSFGDWYCLMQGRGDKRHNKDGLRPEHTSGDYINAVVNDSVSWLEPYAESIAMLADGNHETGIRKHLEVDVTDWTARRLEVPRMGYAGFIRFEFKRGKSKRGAGGNSYLMYFHHGSGGGGPVTRDTIRTARQNAYVDGADFIVGGHVHERWMMETPLIACTNSGRTYIRNRTHIRCSTYKQEFDLTGGFHVERSAPPKPLGGWWLRFYYNRKADRMGRVGYELIPTDGG